MEIVLHRVLGRGEDQLQRVCAGLCDADRLEFDVYLLDERLVVAHGRRDASRSDAVDVAVALGAAREGGYSVLLDIKDLRTARAAGEAVAASGWAANTLLCGELSAVEAAASIAGAQRAWTLPTERPGEFTAARGPLGTATGRARRRVCAAAALVLDSRRADALCVERRFVTADLVDIVHARGGRVLAWLVNDTRTARRLATLGVDGLITDRPARIRAVTESLERDRGDAAGSAA